MIAQIREFFRDYLEPEAPTRPERPPPLQLAAAALLIEVSRADYELAEGERQTVIEALRQQFGVDAVAVTALVELAQTEVEEAVSLYQFTRLVNEHYSAEQKRELIGLMWQVAYADGHLDKYEDHLIRKVADLIYVPHSEFIRQKLAAQPNSD